MTEPLRVLIADDEQVARRRLARLLRAFPDVVIAGECASGEEVLAHVRQSPVDVILLDINMPEFSGMDAMQLLPAPKPVVIFCTAHAEHAVQAFDVGAIDYLLKPIEAGRLAKAMERARAHRSPDRSPAALNADPRGEPPGPRDLPARHPASSGSAFALAGREPSREAERSERGGGGRVGAEGSGTLPGFPCQRLAIPTRDGIVLLDPGEVTHAVLEDELVTIYTTRATYLTDFTLQDLEGRLGRIAERVHRKALLNLEHVLCLEPSETGGFVARMRNGKLVQVSRQCARELRRRLGLRRGPGDAADEED